MESNNTFNIILPENTDCQVIEWFEFFNTHSNLSDELIKLVQNTINSDENKQLEPLLTQTPITSPDSFFDNLYNWQDSNIISFSDEKKQKKKMLQV